MIKKVLFDMDGTIAQFYENKECLEEMYSGTYFKYLTPYGNVLMAAKMLIENGYEVGIISACVTEKSKEEKLFWLHYYLPEIKSENILFCDFGADKAKEYTAQGGELSHTILVDDYTKNLVEWETAGGISVKLRNELNGTNGTWRKRSINYKDSPEDIYHYLADTIWNIS